MSLFKEVLKAFIGIVLAILIFGGIAFGIYKLTSDKEPEAESPTSIEVDVITAKVSETPATNTPETLNSIIKTGLIQAGQEVAIYPEVSAKVIATYVKEGQSVVKGQKLATIGDSSQMKTAKVSYQTAAALLANAESTLGLVATSNAVNYSTYQPQIQNAELSLEQARLQLESARFIRYEQQIIQDAKALQDATTSASLFNLNIYGSASDEQTLYNDYLKEQVTNDQSFVSDREKNLQEYQGVTQDKQNILQYETVENQLELLIKQLQLSTIKSNIDLINAQNQIIQLRQQLESARISLESGLITSPINGVVSLANFDIGETVGPQTAMFTITNLGSVIIETSISPEEYFKITDAKNIETVVKVLDKTVPATISYIGVAANSITKTIPVKVEPKITEAQIKRRFIPNTFAKVEFLINDTETVSTDTEDQFMLPIVALKFEDDGIKVAVVVNGKVEYKTVKLAPPIKNGLVKIASGLNDGDLVILETTDLPTGAKVTANIIQQ
jgi:multidrug efflux pump subunit AcrA (membrane-fusion protein)